MSLAKVKVTFLPSIAIEGLPSPDMEKAIRRAIVLHDLVNQARYVEITCGWHKGGRPADAYVDPLNHCTFKALDTRRVHLKTLHGHPESEIPASMADEQENWRVPSGVTGRSGIINQQLRIARGPSRPGGSMRPDELRQESRIAGGPSRPGFSLRPDELRRENIIARGPSRLGSSLRPDELRRDNRNLRQGGLRDSSLMEARNYLQGSRVANMSTNERFTRTPVQDELVAPIAQLSLSSSGNYIPPHRRISLMPKSSGKDNGYDRRTSSSPFELLNRPPLANKSTNTKMASSQVESSAKAKNVPGPDDEEQKEKGEFGLI
ncbi:hypothetical protein BLS_006764 [Venturia inaequalis]|uniref:Uncharacterized protein n=1 Tax=Venturia inaequalis TaxID=5025 RepID=A0A8H3YRI2_VENIN|nr:hypothetical protein BLS_006764 [Venturia inaequalis]